MPALSPPSTQPTFLALTVATLAARAQLDGGKTGKVISAPQAAVRKLGGPLGPRHLALLK